MMVTMDTEHPTVRPLLLPMEAAAILRIGRSTIYRLISAGEIETVSVGVGRGRHLRITHDALEAYIERAAHRTTTGDPNVREPLRPI